MSLRDELRGILRLRPLQLLALSCLLAGLVSLIVVAKTFIEDPDIWWHLKVGDWIIEQHAVPHVGIFSRTAANRPWVAYSWGYEVLLSRAYAWFGLMGVGVFGLLLTVAVAWVFFWMLYRLSGHFWIAWILCAAGCCAFLFSLHPRPVFFSMAFFAIMLALILEAHRSGRIQVLYWLPVLFAVWANFHIQFIYGLFVIGLLLGVNVLQRVATSLGIEPTYLRKPTLPPVKLAGIFAACALAACVGPYSYHLYEVVLTYSQSKAAYSLIQELQALDFRYFTDYCLLLVTAAGFFAVGWRKKVDLFKVGLLMAASVAAFRTSRDAFFVAICAAAFMADSGGDEGGTRAEHREGLKLPEVAGVGVAVALLLALIGGNADFNTRALDRSISQEYPVDAVNFLRRNPVPGPIYNHLNWGGFLIWYMPDQPVYIDGRNDLYGDELDVRSFRTNSGQSYELDRDLNEANLVLLPKTVPLATMLGNDPKYRLIYEDQLSVAFVRK